MSDSSIRNQRLHDLLGRAGAGDRAARDELFGQVSTRLEKLARKMLRDFPRVGRWAEASDVVQNAVIRLLHALGQVRPTTVPDFFNLAAAHLRRELLDLARQVRGRKGGLTCRAAALAEGDSDDNGYRPEDRDEDPGELDRWCAFHQAVEGLPAEEREVVGLIYYHGWKQAEVGELLHMSTRNVRRRWESALNRIRARLEEP
jgi:RNA polymerase sigma-70 factor (ECF subfamily)